MFAKFVGRRTLQRIFAANDFRDVRNERICSPHRHNSTTVEPNFSAWTENQNTIGALRPDRNFATWVHLPRLGSAPLIGFLANIHRKIGRKTLIWQICCEQDAYCILSTLIFHRIVENAVDYRARIYVSLYSFMPCSSLNHDRSTGLYLSVINCDTLMHRQMPRS